MRSAILISILFFLLLSFSLSADQSSSVDSLIHLLETKNTRPDTNRVRLLNKVAYQLLTSELERSHQYSLEAIDLSNKLNFGTGLSRATYLVGSYYWQKGDNVTSIRKCEEALAIAKEINSPYHIATALNGLGVSYVQLNSFERGLSYLHEALEEAKKSGDEFLIAALTANIGWLHLRVENYDIAESHFLRLIDLGKQKEDTRMLINNNVALGTLYRKKGDYTKALVYFDKSMKLSEETKDIDKQGYSHIYYGEIYSELGRQVLAEYHLLKAKSMFEEIKANNRLLNAYASLSEFYTTQKRHEEANDIASQGLSLAIELESNEYQPTFYKSLIQAKSAARDYENAFLLQKEFMVWNDSLNAKKKKQKVLELETIYKIESIEDENEMLKIKEENQANQIKLQYLIFFFILASLVFVGLTLLSLNRKNKKLRIANEEVMKSSKVKQEFISTMSHEIRTPLNAIIGFTELLATEKPRVNQVEYVNGLKTSSQHLLELINNVLAFSKINAKKIELEHIPFDLQKQLQSLINTYQISNTNENLSIELNSDLKLDQLLIGDPTRLYQVLSNLLSNATKFTRKGIVALEIETLNKTAEDVKLRFVVQDTGIGIPEDKQQLIFEDFIQGSNATTREFGGSGLGLSICQQLLALMDSEMQLKSEVGKGSEFSFDLNFPLAQRESRMDLIHPTSVPQELPLKDQRILLAEDNLLNQKIALTLLQRNGATVTIANNGQEAVDCVQQQDFDLVLMDLHMPVMDGFEAIDKIKALPFPKNETQIIVLTATAAGVELKYPIDFIQKPFNVEQLIEAAQRNLSTRV